MKTSIIILMAAATLMLTACGDPGAKQAKGFRLPDGDVKAGREAFVALNCHTCHSIDGVSLPDPPSKGQYSVKLGGEVYRVRSYGDLVTAIIHPAHDISKPFKSATPPTEFGDDTKSDQTKSPMPDFNNTITAQQLIDITTFLHSRYKQRPQEDYDYTYLF